MASVEHKTVDFASQGASDSSDSKQLVVKSTDMLPKMQNKAMSTTVEAFAKSSSPSDVAKALKTAFDSEYQPMWHCIVGQNFGSNVVHTSRCFIFMDYKGQSILLFKCGAA